MTASPSVGALAGIRVLDLSRILGGPYCGQILGDHGADVLKVEPPGGDDTRTWGPPFRDGVASYYHGLNRNKRVQHLDLTTPADREKLLALVAQAETGQKFVPFAPREIEICPAGMSAIIIGMRKGLIRFGPFSAITIACCSSVAIPPMPEPTITPIRSASTKFSPPK